MHIIRRILQFQNYERHEAVYSSDDTDDIHDYNTLNVKDVIIV